MKLTSKDLSFILHQKQQQLFVQFAVGLVVGVQFCPESYEKHEAHKIFLRVRG
jgi:hypothetical protein